MDRHTNINHEVINAFLEHRPSDWDAVAVLASGISDSFRNDAFFHEETYPDYEVEMAAKQRGAMHDSVASSAIGLGALVAKHNQLNVSSIGYDDLRMLRDYGLCVVFFEGFIGHLNKLKETEEFYEEKPDHPLAGFLRPNPNARKVVHDKATLWLQRHQDEDRSFPPAASLEAVIRQRFFERGEDIEEEYYELMAIIIASPKQPKPPDPPDFIPIIEL